VFKKTFLAVAVGAALGSTGAFAADTATLEARTTNTWSNEATVNVSAFTLPNVTVTLNKEYTPNDMITLTYSPGVTGDFPSTINVDDGLDSSAEGAFTMTLGLLDASEDGTSVTYRVTELTSTGSGSASAISTTGSTFVMAHEDAGITAPGTVTMDMSSMTSASSNLETAAAIDMIEFDDQLILSVTAGTEFSNVIDVEAGLGEDYNNVSILAPLLSGSSPGGLADGEDAFFSTYNNVESAVFWDYENAPSRAIFTTGDGEDSASIMIADSDSEAHHLANVVSVGVTLTGPLGFLVDEDGVTPGIQNDAFVATLDGAGGIDGSREVTGVIDGNSITFTFPFDSVTVGNEVGFHFDNSRNGDGTNDMFAGTFSATAQLEYVGVDADYLGVDTDAVDDPSVYDFEDDEPTTVSSSDMADAGAWSMDGSIVTVYAMPVTPMANGFVWVSVSNQEDDATTTIFAEAIGTNGEAYQLPSVSIVGNGIVKLSNNLYDDMAAAGVPGGRANIRVATTAPACDVNVSATYKVEGDADRLTLETSQTINGVHNTGNSGYNNDLCIL